ncbi:hypothetical protein Pan44_07190 [Caulifigura coniformis]|uniref:Uncharacterized protein n=1 Tax=Caulifigura coniformis TaxID=2527983 RepID=A0A517S996_9PLAN|nr:hypothetical protein Pan44_07190 [Caulifigura coniformis]
MRFTSRAAVGSRTPERRDTRCEPRPRRPEDGPIPASHRHTRRRTSDARCAFESFRIIVVSGGGRRLRVGRARHQSRPPDANPCGPAVTTSGSAGTYNLRRKTLGDRRARKRGKSRARNPLRNSEKSRRRAGRWDRSRGQLQQTPGRDTATPGLMSPAPSGVTYATGQLGSAGRYFSNSAMSFAS